MSTVPGGEPQPDPRPDPGPDPGLDPAPDPEPDDGVFDPLHRLMLSTFRRHAIGFAVVAVVVLVAKFAGLFGEWTPWFLYAWGLLVAFQFFYVRAADVDEDWIEERVADLNVRSYDLGHIQDIKDRIEDRDASVRPSDERD